MKTLRYGTRGSALALAQAAWVARLLERECGLACEPVVIATSGDRFSRSQPPDPAGDAPNVKAMFVKEIEEALLAGTIDFAVHSAKDMPGDVPDGLMIAAVPPREDPRDVYVGGPAAKTFAAARPTLPIGTASLRRRIQLALKRPELKFAPLRGNVDTRLKRCAAGEFAGIVLARAGLRRLGLAVDDEALPVDLVVPAPGQGALAVEARADRRDVLALLAKIHDERAGRELAAERALLKAMGGGCSTPLGCLAQTQADGLRLSVFWSDADGARHVRLVEKCGFEDGEQLAVELARRVMEYAS